MIRCNSNVQRETAHLIVDQYLREPRQASMLSAALKHGLIDWVARVGLVSHADLCADGVFPTASGLHHGFTGTTRAESVDELTRLLVDGDVFEQTWGEPRWRISRSFRQALRFRDLLTIKLDLALMASTLSRARLLAAQETDEYAHLFRRYDTALSRFEVDAVAARFPLAEHRRMLDVGGGEGEFALQLCRRFPALRPTVLELPAVCAAGRRRMERELRDSGEQRVEFLTGDASAARLPTPYDLIVFKSMLPTLSADAVAEVLASASESLPCGGRVLIFERLPLPSMQSAAPFHFLPALTAFPERRSPEIYLETLDALGFLTRLQSVYLDQPFGLITATKRSGRR